MKYYETITAHGTGYWGEFYKIDLVTVDYVITSKWSDRFSSIIRYEIRFISLSGRSDCRIFSNDQDRSDFLKKNLVGLELTALLKNESFTECEYFLSRLTGNKLVSIVFIHDYLQMNFENMDCFILYSWPVIEQEGERVEKGQAGYFDSLYSFITSPVLNVDVYQDAGLVLEFAKGAIEVPLNPDDYPLEPEIAIYQGSNGVYQVWRKGEDVV